MSVKNIQMGVSCHSLILNPKYTRLNNSANREAIKSRRQGDVVNVMQWMMGSLVSTGGSKVICKIVRGRGPGDTYLTARGVY